MTPSETAAILAQLPADTEITVTVRLQDWLAARDAAQGGPEYVDAAGAARVVGFTIAYWGRMAREGRIPGATQAGRGGRWKLPLAACRAHIQRLSRRPPAVIRPTLMEFKPRGPRKTSQQTKTA